MAIWDLDKNRYKSNNGKLFEVVMVAGQTGPTVYTPSGNLNAASDAFGRLRVSEPHTLFDSSFRFNDNAERWNTRITGTGAVTHNTDEGLMDITVGNADGDEVVRQTDRTFGYQPGKSLLIMNSFTMSTPKTNLRQRVGYFTKDNGFYVEADGTDIYLVKRSSVTGSVVETKIAQADWNVDKLDGTGTSEVTLNFSKSQIMWMDVEWLGVGSIRMGFIVNCQFLLAHVFHHANDIEGTYITTGSLSLRSEITNTGVTTGSTTYKQICSTVISEGGYDRTGLTRSVANPFPGRSLSDSGENPMVSIRLRQGRTEAVVHPREITMYGYQNTPFQLKIIRGGELSGGSWELVDSASSVEYNLSATDIQNGTTIFSQIFKGQSTITPTDLFVQFSGEIQLTRGIITGDSEGDLFTVVINPNTNNDDALAAVTWQEKTT